MGYYRHHVFVCTHHKSDGRKSCQDGNPKDICDYLKERLKSQNLYGDGKVRVSSSGCLGRCEVGPNIVIYPDNVWVHYETREDVDRMIDQYLKDESTS